MALALLLAGFGAASAQAPSALISQFRGDVKVHKVADGAVLPAKVGLQLFEGDRVDVARGSRAVLLFKNGRLVTATTPIVVAAMGGAGAAEVFERVARTLAGAERLNPPEAKSAFGRPPPAGAYPLAPAFGSAVVGDRPTFAWQPQEGTDTYLVQIRPAAGGAPLRFTVPGAGPWELPDTVAPLTRGAEYVWTVVPLPGGRAAAEERFRVLDAEALASLTGFRTSLVEAGVDPDGDGLLVVAVVSADLGLLHEAEAALERLLAATPEAALDPSVGLLHAQVLEKLGRTDEARAAYDRAQRTGAVTPPAAAPQESELPTLAVLDLKDGGSMGPDVQDLSSLGAGLAMMLTTEMMRNPRTAMVERDQIKQLIAEQGLTLSGMIDPATAIEVGKLVGAEYMLFGTYTDIMSRLRIDVRVVDVETGRLRQAREVTRPREQLFEAVAELAALVFEDLELLPAEKLPERRPAPAPAVIFFSKGIGHEDRGEVEQARAMYQRALEIFPDYQEARERLAKLGAGS